MISSLSLRDLEYIVAVADNGSFIRAADLCRVAQPTLSVQVRKVESLLGVTLFERTTRRVLVTTTGRGLVDQARKVLLEAGALYKMAEHNDQPFHGTLELAAVSTISAYFFPQIIRPLRSRHPGLVLNLSEGLAQALVQRLLSGELDAIVVSDITDDTGLVVEQLFTDKFALACAIDLPSSDFDVHNWEQLNTIERLVLEEGHCMRTQAIRAFGAARYRSRQAAGLEALKYMVAAGEGCALLPALAIHERDQVRYIRPSGERYARPINLVWRRGDLAVDQYVDLAAQLAVLAQSQKLGELPAWIP